jgi:hypothetical protein
LNPSCQIQTTDFLFFFLRVMRLKTFIVDYAGDIKYVRIITWVIEKWARTYSIGIATAQLINSLIWAKIRPIVFNILIFWWFLLIFPLIFLILQVKVFDILFKRRHQVIFCRSLNQHFNIFLHSEQINQRLDSLYSIW